MARPLDREAGVPRHIAIIMDGNGRWAARRALPRHFGHRAGVKAVRTVVEGCVRRGVDALTLFAFSSENWGRPAEEVGRLMELFIEAMDREVDDLESNGVHLRFIGDLDALRPDLRNRIHAVESRTGHGRRLTLYVAIAYGGRWDIVNAARSLAARCVAREMDPGAIDERAFAAELQLHAAPEPDLFIRTGGEQRISNFLLWNLAYTELFFCDTLWPDFGDDDLDKAIAHFSGRQRRFGLTSTQVRNV